jgi:hypothetical protein
MALLYGRAGRITSKNGGLRPGQTPDSGVYEYMSAGRLDLARGDTVIWTESDSNGSKVTV